MANRLMPTYRERLLLFVALALVVTVPYFAIQRASLFPVTLMPETVFDRALPFVPAAIWFYLSLYLQLTLPVFLARSRRDVTRVAFGFLWITLVSHAIFLFWPNGIPDLADATHATDPLLRLVLTVDLAVNASPSLHASLASFCALYCARRLKHAPSRVVLWVWTVLILAAALLAKRHVIVDLAAGGVLGWLVFVALFREQPGDEPSSAALQATICARRDVARGLEDNLGPLTQQDWRLRARDGLCFVGLFATGLWLTLVGLSADLWLVACGGIVATALALNAFVLLMHEGMHDTLFTDRRWNRVGSVLLGATFLMSFSAYRVLHLRHHDYLGDSRDPDDYRNYTQRPLLLWSLHFVRLTIGPVLYLFLIPALALKYGDDEDRRRILAEYGFLLVVYSLAFRLVPASTLLVTWGIPLLMVATMTALRGFTQHGITDASDPYIASRTILPHPIVGFFLLHENYHLEHHLFPEVPSYHLPRLHDLAWEGLPRAVSGRGYLQFLAKFLRATARLEETPIGLETRTETKT